MAEELCDLLSRRAERQRKPEEICEKSLDDALKSGVIDEITELVTPRTLTNCVTNPLYKAFQVIETLQQYTTVKGPDQQEFLKLEANLKEYAVSLVEPLKSDHEKRDVFSPHIKNIVDKAIAHHQKKFLAHPVVYDVLLGSWYGEFITFQNSKWTEWKGWMWVFLNLWILLDVILFPVLYLVFYCISRCSRKEKDFRMGFILYATDSTGSRKNTHAIMKQTINGVISMPSVNGQFALIARGGEDVEIKEFEELESMEDVLDIPTQPNWKPPSLRKCLSKAGDFFDGVADSETVKKILVIFTDCRVTKDDVSSDDVVLTNSFIKKIVIPIGEMANTQQLENVLSHGTIAKTRGLEDPIELSYFILCELTKKNIFAWYKHYLLAPNFVFLRDSLSYLVLLLLHCAVCFSSSTTPFSGVEVTIIIFFFGRVLIEVKQLFHAGEYLRDIWNWLDVMSILIFFVIFVLRLVTLRSISVAQNRTLATANYLYGLNTMLLTLRVFGSFLQNKKNYGVMQIALLKIIDEVSIIFWQFLVAVLAFSLAITKISMTERSYLVSTEKEDKTVCKNLGISCWWDTMKHLTWSLLGLADIDKLESKDETSRNLVLILYAMFLVAAVILLVNMMIAVLSNVYQSVEDNSLFEWRYKQVITHQTYSNYHPIPVPLNLISMPSMKIYRFVRKCWCGLMQLCMPHVPGTLEEDKENMNRLMKDLGENYLSRYGCSFSPTDEKMDRVSQELEGNRTMANRIADQVFSAVDPLSEVGWLGKGITVEGNKLTYDGPVNCSDCKDKTPVGHHSICYNRALSKDSPVFEVLIQESGERRSLAVGVASSDNHDCHTFPGCLEKSVGYHIENSRIYQGIRIKQGQAVKMAYRGDIISCRVLFADESEDSGVPVSFNLNGREVGKAYMMVDKNEDRILYPCIGMGHEGISVQFTMGRFNQVIPRLIKCFEEVRKDVFCGFQSQMDKVKQVIPDAIQHNREMSEILVNERFEDVKTKIELVQKKIEMTQAETQGAVHDLQSQINEMNDVLKKLVSAIERKQL